MPLKNSEVEERFISIISEQRISDGDLEEFKSVLRQIMLKVGLRPQNIPQDEEKQVLINHIIGNYGNHTHKEILLAFDMAIEGKLEVEVNCYENFSCVYFSNIMNAYRSWASQVYIQHKSTERPMAFIDQKEDTGDEAMEAWLLDVKKRLTHLEFMPIMLYDWLDQKGRITKTNREKNEYLQSAVAYRHGQLSKMFSEDPKRLGDLQAFNTMKQTGEFEGIEVAKLKDLAKKMILKEYIDGLSE